MYAALLLLNLIKIPRLCIHTSPCFATIEHKVSPIEPNLAWASLSPLCSFYLSTPYKNTAKGAHLFTTFQPVGSPNANLRQGLAGCLYRTDVGTWSPSEMYVRPRSVREFRAPAKTIALEVVENSSTPLLKLVTTSLLPCGRAGACCLSTWSELLAFCCDGTAHLP